MDSLISDFTDTSLIGINFNIKRLNWSIKPIYIIFKNWENKKNYKCIFRDVVSVIIESEEWKDALRNEYISAANIRETPVRLLIKRFPDLAKIVFDKCITSNLHSSRVKKIKAKTVAPEDPQLKVEEITFGQF